MKARQWVALGITAIVAGFFLSYGVTKLNREAKMSPPEPAPLTAWLPTRAEIRPADEVHPGTFSITITLEEFMSRFPVGGLVTFPPRPDSGADQNYLIVLWHPGEGGLFYRATQKIKTHAYWPPDFIVSEVRWERGHLIGYPRLVSSSGQFSLILAAFMGIVGGLLTWGIGMDWLRG